MLKGVIMKLRAWYKDGLWYVVAPIDPISYKMCGLRGRARTIEEAYYDYLNRALRFEMTCDEVYNRIHYDPRYRMFG